MNRRYYCLFVVLFLAVLVRAAASESTFNILFIQSYTSQTPWHSDLNQGLVKGFRESGVKVNITTEYLDADFWAFNSEKVIMRRFCERARERRTDLIVTASDEAFYTLFACGDSLPLQVPVVFFGIKYPDAKLLAAHPNVCGFTANPDFDVILRHAQKIFPQRKDVVCVIDNSFLSNKGCDDFEEGWEIFQQDNPDYSMKIYNTQSHTTSHIIAAICYPSNSYGRIVIAPKWSPFLSFVGKNSKAPVFSTQIVGLTNGVFCAYDSDAYASAFMAGQRASQVLKGTSPLSIGVTQAEQGFIYDYKQLEFFHVDPDKATTAGGIIVNEPYWEKYKFLFILLYPSILALLIASIVWLMRANRRESKRRIQVQTRLLVQNKLVEQRNEFDNVFHSIRDGVITYDTDLHIHFTNRSLLRMLHLPYESGGRFYEGMVAGSIFNIYHEGQNILHKMLKQVARTGESVQIPQGSFMKEVYSENYFPVSGEIVPIYSKGGITGMALSARNISDEEMQKRFFDMALDESSIYPWQFDMKTNCFIFPQGFLVRMGYDESVTTITREEMNRTIHPYDLKEIVPQFDKALTGENKNPRLSFRQRNANGEYEWWEYRSSAIGGLTQDSLYGILGVCQSIQRYKTAEQEMREARDKALQADKLKSAFLANMSHEIRTPLNAIVGFSDLLSDTSGFTEEEIAQFIATINKNCGLLLTLINDILDLSRIESGTMEFMFADHNLPLLLKTVHDSQRLNMPSGVELVLRMPESDKKYLKTDNVRLQQVVNNLINNAAKFTSSGFITFGYEEDEVPGYTRIFVEDTGVGISEEGIRHIFERFYKVDNFTQGAGLGLSICQTIIERLKGSISVTSEVGKGTRFTVRLPNHYE
ncbi:ATP-binding protein [Bacteroides acidifaciens]|uniref:sensor histidine kinase n=1 Tax=Bacteroides acidifaciens TaxID=85831 RepID=UPI0023D01FAE|nr:ATP-binding protein [Bacteroides acidifaciens]MDE6822722.1 histidine kinase [Bacteroides acidifaciens]